MPLEADEVNADERRAEGKRAALIAARIDGEKVEHKSYGDTSPENYPYTYWWKVGYNEGVDEVTGIK